MTQRLEPMNQEQPRQALPTQPGSIGFGAQDIGLAIGIKSIRDVPEFGVWLCLAGLFFWSYWPTIHGMLTTWSSIDDYSYGFLVVPVALSMLWWRRAKCPSLKIQPHPMGLVLIALATVMRLLAGKFFFEALDGWSLVIWIAGATWLYGGWPLLRWSLPAIGFLFFMVPLPFRVETGLSVPLQRIATLGSAWLLQFLGQPALPEGTKIILGTFPLEIERACAGLRMFIGVSAFAYVWAVFSSRPWWHKSALLFGAVPIAIVANILRIAATGLLLQLSNDVTIQRRLHDFAGWFTIVVAAAMLAALSWYMSRLVRAKVVLDSRSLVKAAR